MINHLNNCEEQSKAKHDGQKNANLSNDSKVKTVPVT